MDQKTREALARVQETVALLLSPQPPVSRPQRLRVGETLRIGTKEYYITEVDHTQSPPVTAVEIV
jgi:hypothetical protein